jgi:hypothetical protein
MGRRAVVKLHFGPQAFAHWSTARHEWVISAGSYQILVGSSSRHIYGHVTLHLRQRDLVP